MPINIDLTTLSGWSGLSSGTHTITIKAKATGYRDSNASAGVSVIKPLSVYNITTNLTNVTASAGNPSTITENGTATLTFTADSGYNLPSSVTVSGATSSWAAATGTLTLSNPTTDVSVSITAEQASGNYVLFESDDGAEFTLGTDITATYGGNHSFAANGTFEYSVDGTTWQSWSPYDTISSSNGKIYLRGSNNTYLTTYTDPSCFLYGTKITLADGSKKNVEDLTYNDELRVWDLDEGKFGTASICWLTRKGLVNDHFYRLTFSDGTVLKTTGKNSNHKVYNVDEHFFKGVDKTKVGDRIFSENGIVTVVNKEYIEEEVPYMNLITSRKIDCFAEGILTSDRYGNLYSIDDDMKWIKEDRPVRPLSEFTEAGINEYWYEPLRLSEQTDTVEAVKKYIEKCEAQMMEVE